MRRGRTNTVYQALLLGFGMLVGSPVFGQGLDVQLRPVVSRIVAGCGKAGAKRVTVADFTDLQGQVTELGRYIAEELGASLVEAEPPFGLVDRANLRMIVAEHKLTMSGLVNPDTARKLGQIAGVDGIVTGTITPLGESVHVTVKAIASDTATVMASARADFPRTKAIEELLGRDVSNAGPTIPPGGHVGPGSPPTGGSLPKTESDDFLFEARGCRRVGETAVRCLIAVTNTGSSRKSINVCGTSLVDSVGTLARRSTISFGGGRCGEQLEVGIPLVCTLDAEDVSPQATAVHILLKDGSWGSFRQATLRDIPLR